MITQEIEMRQLLSRTFSVDAAPDAAWETIVAADTWPVWARHIARVELTPPGRVGPSTLATIVLTNRTTARVAVVAYDEGRRFRWDGRFLWLALAYDHILEPTNTGGTTITFTVAAAGRGTGSIGRVFAAIYARHLDRAIPRLRAELDSCPAQPPWPTTASGSLGGKR
jgi:hypothetical protein